MAAAPQADLVKITINDVEIEVPRGELIVESVKRLGLEIPIFCYHPRMKPVGMCRMCLVEVGFKQQDGSVRKMPKPQAGCTLPASDNMVVYTDTEMVHRDRKGVLEFLLINHPLDCPICDRGGECPLQNNTLAYGPSTSRFTEIKRHLPKAYPLSEFVTLDLERCIQCGRCVRFTEEISGDSQLAFRFRGASMQPSTFQLTSFESRFSGNVIEICPVGALTSSKYRFRARPWDLETKPGLCTLTPCGTNVWFDYRAGRFIRINGRTNEAVNEEWTSDATKFGHDFYNSADRLDAPNLRKDGSFARVAWSDAYAEILPQFEGKGEAAAVIFGSNLSNEDIYSLQKMARSVFGASSVDAVHGSPYGRGEAPAQGSLTIADLEHQDAVLVFGANLAAEQPMSHLRLRKGWFQNGMKVVAAHHEACEADLFAHVTLRYREGDEQKLAEGLAALVAGSGDAAGLAQATGIQEQDLKDAAEALRASRVATLATHSLAWKSKAAVSALAKMPGQFWLMAPTANAVGAELLGGTPHTLANGEAAPTGRTVREILEDAAAGKIKALWLANCDPIAEFPDRALAEKALENVDYLVVQHSRQTDACAYASAVLPMTLPAEQDGTYTSVEGRVQRMAQILAPRGEAKPVWRTATEVSLRAKPGTPAFNPREVMEEIASVSPAYRGITYAALDGEGVLVGAGEPAEVS